MARATCAVDTSYVIRKVWNVENARSWLSTEYGIGRRGYGLGLGLERDLDEEQLAIWTFASHSGFRKERDSRVRVSDWKMHYFLEHVNLANTNVLGYGHHSIKISISSPSTR